MIEVKYIPPTFQDCMAMHSVTMDKEYTLYDFINTILKERSNEWGSFIVTVDNKRLECEYRSGGIIKQEIPKEVLERSIESVEGHGGYTCMNYYIKLSEAKKDKVFNVWEDIATDKAIARMLEIALRPDSSSDETALREYEAEYNEIFNRAIEEGAPVELDKDYTVEELMTKLASNEYVIMVRLFVKNFDGRISLSTVYKHGLVPLYIPKSERNRLVERALLTVIEGKESWELYTSVYKGLDLCNKCGAKNLSTGKCSNFNCERNK